MLRHFIRPIFLAAIAALAAGAGPGLHAQRLGFEVGMAGVENYDGVTPALGVAAFVPLTDRFRAAASFSQWVGCDDTFGCEDPRAGYGNRGINLVGLYRVAGTRSMNASLGAGIGWYEMRRVREGESHRYYQDALTLSAELRRAVAYNSAVYLRADTSFPSDENRPRWSGIRAGVDVGGIF